MNENLKKNAVWNLIGTTINAFASLIFMIIVTRVNGISDAGIFTFGFSVATMFNIIGVYAGRIYQVTEKNKISNKDFLYNRIISCIFMIIISFAFVFINGYNFVKALIIILLCLLKMFEAFSDVIYGFLQKKLNLYKVGISLTLKNTIGLLVFTLFDLITKDIIISIISFILIYILFLLFYDLRQCNLKKVIKEKLNLANVKEIFYRGFPTFFTAFLTIYIINSSKYVIDKFSSNSDQAIFGIIIMPATIMILIAQFVIHPFLTMMDENIKKKDYNSLIKIITKLSIFVFLVGIIGVIGCHFIGINILELFYGVKLSKYRLCLDIILFGSIFYALTSIINTVLIAMRHTVIQMIIYIITSIFAFISSYFLVKSNGIYGASLNYFIVMLINYLVFLLSFFIIYKKERRSK